MSATITTWATINAIRTTRTRGRANSGPIVDRRARPDGGEVGPCNPSVTAPAAAAASTANRNAPVNGGRPSRPSTEAVTASVAGPPTAPIVPAHTTAPTTNPLRAAG